MTAPAPTGGADLVYAVRLPQVNARIAAQHASPKTFSTMSDLAAVSGTFGTWRITQGGSGRLVYLSIPLDGSLNRTGAAAIPFSGVATVSVEMNYLPASVGGSSRQTLRIKQPSPAEADRTSSLFSIIQVDFGEGLDVVEQVFIRSALQDWLLDNPGVFDCVLATIDLTEVAAEAPYAWLRPTALSYAYADSADENECLLAILAMTQERPSTDLNQQVAAGIIPDGFDAALLISSWLLLNSVLLRALPVTFPGTDVSDFEVSEEGPALTLLAPRQLSSLDCQGVTYEPVLQTFSLVFQGTQIACRSQTSIPVLDGVTAHTSVDTAQGLTMATNAAGQRVLNITEIGQPRTRHWTETDSDIDTTNEAVGAGLAVAGLVASAFTGGLAGLFIALGAALVGGVVADLPEFISDWTSETAPSLDLVAANVAAPFVWNGGAPFAAAAVDLAESLRFSGTPWSSPLPGKTS